MTFCVLSVISQFISLTDESGKPLANNLTFHNIVANLLAIFPFPGRLTITPDFAVLRIAWALRVELAFYLSVGFLLTANRVRNSPSFRTLNLGTIAVLLSLCLYGLATGVILNPLIQMSPYFCAGSAFYWMLKGSKAASALLVISILFSVGFVYGEQGNDLHAYVRSNVGATALFILLAGACMAVSAKPISGNAIDRRLGDLSYPVYVGHWLPLLALASYEHAFAPSIVAKLAATVMAFTLPLAYYAAVEPAVARLRTIVRGVAIR